MTYGQPYAPEPPKKSKNKALVIALLFLCAAVIFLCCAGIASGALGGSNKDKASKALVIPEATFTDAGPGTSVGSDAAEAATSVAPKPTRTVAAPVVLGAGDYEVGKATSVKALTIAPGTYAIKADGYHCYWARLKGFSGEITDIIANDNLFDGASARVTVKKTDKGLHLTGNCEVRRK